MSRHALATSERVRASTVIPALLVVTITACSADILRTSLGGRICSDLRERAQGCLFDALDRARRGGAKAEGHGDRFLVVEQQGWHRGSRAQLIASLDARCRESDTRTSQFVYIAASWPVGYFRLAGKFMPRPISPPLEQGEEPRSRADVSSMNAILTLIEDKRCPQWLLVFLHDNFPNNRTGLRPRNEQHPQTSRAHSSRRRGTVTTSLTRSRCRSTGLRPTLPNCLPGPKLALTSELFELKPGFQPRIAKSTAELLEIFDQSVKEGRMAIDAATEEDMQKNWSFKFGETIAFTAPRTSVLRSFINHLVHHRAQLGVYLRINGIAIPGMYGPSADEQ